MSNVLTDEEKRAILEQYYDSKGESERKLVDRVERSVLAKAGEQEPVAVMHNNGMTSAKHEFSDIDAFLRSCRNNTPLYAHPAPQQAIPEYVTVSQVPHSQYAQGWNDCVDIMLSASPKIKA